jgi:hypothetical protein
VPVFLLTPVPAQFSLPSYHQWALDFEGISVNKTKIKISASKGIPVLVPMSLAPAQSTTLLPLYELLVTIVHH